MLLPCPAGSCVSKESPCRSITCAISSAVAGDTIIVGPGRYGDLNRNGTPGDSIGEEIPAPGCGCMLAMNKAVSLISSDGAAATAIDGRSVGGANSVATVLIFSVGGEFGRPGKGFTVTNTVESSGTAIVVDANNVAIRGNQVVSFRGLTFNTATGTGIRTVDFPQTISIEGNQLMGWGTAISAGGDGKTIRKNAISLCSSGIFISGNSRATGNVIVGTAFSVEPKQTAAVVGNAFYGDRITVNAQPGFTGVIQKNNFVGSSDDCALTNLSQTNDLDVTNNYWGGPYRAGPRSRRRLLRCPRHGDGRAIRDEAVRGQGTREAMTHGRARRVSMAQVLRSTALAMSCMLWAVPQAHAVTGAVCIKKTLNGSLKLRSAGICKPSEIQIGSFDGTTLQLTGINVQIVSGSGATDGAVNGRGNLIVGYNAASSVQTRTGSHNVVVGDEHEYTSYGGLVAGFKNTITGPFASVSGGRISWATGTYASVSGGVNNTASGESASASGGRVNTASGLEAAVSGGAGNTASGLAASVSGGINNQASNNGCSVSGGAGNTASGFNASVAGGLSNVASGTDSSISGGAVLTQPAQWGWAAGSVTGNVVVGNFESP